MRETRASRRPTTKDVNDTAETLRTQRAAEEDNDL